VTKTALLRKRKGKNKYSGNEKNNFQVSQIILNTSENTS